MMRWEWSVIETQIFVTLARISLTYVWAQMSSPDNYEHQKSSKYLYFLNHLAEG